MNKTARHTLYMAERERAIRLNQAQREADKTTKILFGLIVTALFVAGCVIALSL